MTNRDEINRELPANWAAAKFSDLYELLYGKSLTKKERNSSGQHPVYGSNGVVDYHDEYLIEAPAIVVGRKGAAGAVSFATDNFWPIDTTYYICDDKFIDIKFSFYLLTSLRLNQFEKSTAIPGISRSDVYDLPISVPPIKEQHRIVAKIEELFSELDKGIESLKTAREQLKVYRQAVLKHAFEGKLTARWREENKDVAQGGVSVEGGQEPGATKLETADQLLARIQKKREYVLKKLAAGGNSEAKRFLNKISKNTAKHPMVDLPAGAIWVNLLELCTFVVDCHNKTAPYQNAGIHLIRTPCIRNGRIHLNNEARFVSQETYEYWARRCPPKPGDIIFTREAPIGEVGIVPPGITLCMGQRMMLLRLPDCIDSKYILYCILGPTFQSRMMEASIGTGVKHLRVGDVEKLCVPLFPLEEQKQIVALVESDLSIIDGQEHDIERVIFQSETLRQSILKKAFSCQLVAQDPNDEPAAVLLKHIKAEKTAQASARKLVGKRKSHRKEAI